MSDTSPKVTFELLQAVVRNDEEPFYVMHVTDPQHLGDDPAACATNIKNAWQHMWKSRGYTDETVPLLWMMGPGMTLTALSGDELRAAGLVRIN